MIFNNKVEQKLGLRYYQGGASSGSGQNTSQSNGSGNSVSSSQGNSQLNAQQVLAMYGSALPSLANTTTATANTTQAAPATNAAVNGSTQAVNAINLNGLSPGEYNATERSVNQGNTSTGNLGLNNGTNTINNAMNFGGAFNNKIGLMNNATNAASTASNAANNTTSTTANLFSPISTNANTNTSTSNSNSLFNNTSSGSGSSNNSGASGGICFLTTACCVYKGLPDNCLELTTLRKFRDKHVPKELVDEYYKIAPLIVEKIKGIPTVLDYIYNTVKDCVKYINDSDYGIALNRYRMMVDTLKHICNI